MQIENGSVVAFHYTLSDAEGKTLESSRGGHPTEYLHGSNNILPRLEEAFAGKQVGDQFEVSLSAADGYGERKADSVQRVAAKYLKHEGKLRPGQAVRLNTQDGTMMVTVVKVGKFSVDVDTNHPLSGLALTYAIEIDAVRQASAEERAHGHAHGVGGHNH